MGVRVAAALAWWDEPVEFLDRLVASLDGHVDELIAFDGRWAGMPGPRDLSTLEEVLALERGRHHGFGVTIVRGAPFAWESQVAKRDALMHAAAEIADWILVIDGDEFLQSRCDLRERLADTDAVSADVTIMNMNRPWPYNQLAPIAYRSPRLFRAGTRVVGRHNGYVYDGQPARFNRVDLADEVTVWHDNQARPSPRRAAAQDYRRARRVERLEVAA